MNSNPPAKSPRRLRVVTNFDVNYMGDPPDMEIHALSSLSARHLVRALRDYDIILLNGNPGIRLICLLKFFLRGLTARIVSVDLILDFPVTPMEWIRAWIFRLLSKEIDVFILYFKHTMGYRKLFGIRHNQLAYVAFKPSFGDKTGQKEPRAVSDTYVACLGHSMRDTSTFFHAMRITGLPGKLVCATRKDYVLHNTPLDLSHCPPNVEFVEHDTIPRTFESYLEDATIVVIPLLPGLIRAPVAVALQAMARRKCVIITRSASTHGLYHDEAIKVPPCNPEALARAITSAWNNDVARQRTAEAGYRYAMGLKGSARLMKDILDIIRARLAEEQKAKIAKAS